MSGCTCDYKFFGHTQGCPSGCSNCGEPLRTCGDPEEGDGCGMSRCYQCKPHGTQPCDYK